MPIVLDLQILGDDVGGDRGGGREGTTSCSIQECSMINTDAFAQ